MDENRQPTNIEESFAWMDFVKPWAAFDNPDSKGTWWAPKIGDGIGYNAYLKIFQTAWFNLAQRFGAEYLYKTSPIAQSAVDQLCTFIIGTGFDYSSDDPETQEKLEEFEDVNDWKDRSQQLFQRLIVDGENFLRTSEGSLKVRIVLPDYIQGGENANQMGIVRNPIDYEEIKSYIVKYPDVNPISVPAKYMQHRKLGWGSELRGTSLIFSVANHIRNAESLVVALTKGAEFQAKIAAIREHNSPLAAVQQFKTTIQGAPCNLNNQAAQGPSDVVGNIESYAEGSILDLPDSVKMRLMSEGLNATQFIEVLRATLRLVACRFGLNEHILSQDADSMAAYSASLVQESPMARTMEKWQAKWLCWEKQLFKQVGIDPKKVKALAPEVIWRKDADSVQVGDFLLRNKIASKETIGKLFEIDYEDEIESIKKDLETFPETEEDLNSPFDREDRDTNNSEL